MDTPAPPPPVTLRDVAEAARVHFSTVSLALRADPRIAAGTRERVVEVARRLGYQPNPAAQALVRRRQGRALGSPVLGFIVPEGTSPREGPASVVAGARTQAQRLGFTLRIYPLGRGRLASRTLEARLQKDGVECLILAHFSPRGVAPRLTWDRYCVVRIDSQHLEPAFHTVSTDQIHNVRLAFRTLRARGAQRIGLCVGREREAACRQRHAMGYLMEVALFEPADRLAPLWLPTAASEARLESLLRPWLTRQQPDAVLHDGVASDRLWGRVASGVLRCSLVGAPKAGASGLEPMARVVGERAVSSVAMLLRIGSRGIPAVPLDTYVEGRWCDEK